MIHATLRLLLVLTLIGSGVSAQLNPYGQVPEAWKAQLHNQSEYYKYIAALPSVQLEFDPSNPTSRVARVYRELVEFSGGKQFPLYPAQTGSIGQAHRGGLILIDISKLAEPDDVLAFWMAHEWGHQDLGHQPNIYLPQGGLQWQYRQLPISNEDAADAYAGRFLKAYGYGITAVQSNLRALPNSPASHGYSNSEQRARKVRKAYDGAKGSGNGGGGAGHLGKGKTPVVTYEACQHPAHPGGHFKVCEHQLHAQGDIFPCTHPVHFNGDLVPCQHYTPYGPAHGQGDLIPCQHAAHLNGDLRPCQHEAHPGGHTNPCMHTAHPQGHKVVR